MNNQDWQGRILLQGFDKEEIESIKKIIDKYEKRLRRFDYKELRLTLQRHRKGGEKGRAFLNEINCLMKLEKNLLHAAVTSHEFYPAIAEVIEKIEKEAEHIIKLEEKRKGK